MGFRRPLAKVGGGLRKSRRTIIKRLLFIPASIIVWFIFSFYTLEYPCDITVASCEPLISWGAIFLGMALILFNIFNVFRK